MSSEKPLSSVDTQYNSLKDVQTSSYLDSSKPMRFDAFSKKINNQNKPMIDTSTYLKQIEIKYEKKHKKQQQNNRTSKKNKAKKYQDKSQSSSYDSAEGSDNDSGGYQKVNHKGTNHNNDVPQKFQQIQKNQTAFSQENQTQQLSYTPKNQIRQQENLGFYLPQNLSLSKGASERMNDSPPQYSQYGQKQEQGPNWQVLDKMHLEYSQNQNRPIQGYNLSQIQGQSVASYGDMNRLTQNNQNNKSKFFEIINDLKSQLPYSHPGKQKLNAQLYSQCVKENVQESQWLGWIQNNLERS